MLGEVIEIVDDEVKASNEASQIFNNLFMPMPADQARKRAKLSTTTKKSGKVRA